MLRIKIPNTSNNDWRSLPPELQRGDLRPLPTSIHVFLTPNLTSDLSRTATDWQGRKKGWQETLDHQPLPSALFNFLKPLALRSRTGWSLPTPTGLIWFVNLTNRLSRRSSLDDGAIMATCEEKAKFFCLIFISSENFVFFKLEMARSEIERNYTGKFKFQWDIKHSRQIFPTPLCIISHFQGVKKRFIKKS